MDLQRVTEESEVERFRLEHPRHPLDEVISLPEDEGSGDIKLVGHITWTNSAPDFSCRSLHSAFEIVVGSYDSTTKKLRLRGIATRHHPIGRRLVAATGFDFQVADDFTCARGN